MAVFGLLVAVAARIWGTTPLKAPSVFPQHTFHLGSGVLSTASIGLFAVSLVLAGASGQNLALTGGLRVGSPALGGAVFIASGATAQLSYVSVQNSLAIAGAGGDAAGFASSGSARGGTVAICGCGGGDSSAGTQAGGRRGCTQGGTRLSRSAARRASACPPRARGPARGA